MRNHCFLISCLLWDLALQLIYARNQKSIASSSIYFRHNKLEAMILIIHGMCIRAHRAMTPQKRGLKSDEQVLLLLDDRLHHISNRLESNEYSAHMEILESVQVCFAWGMQERFNIIMKLRATNVAALIWADIFQHSCTAIIPQEPNHGWVHTIQRDTKSTITLGAPSSSTQAPVFCHSWRSSNFTDSWQGSTGAAYTRLDLDSAPGGVWWRAHVPVPIFWPYAYISTHYNEDQPSNSNQIRGVCCSNVQSICYVTETDYTMNLK